MRLIAAALVVALLLPPAAAAAFGARDACCCKNKASASCPMKRSAKSCTPKAASCGMRNASSPTATLLPPIGIHRPVLLTAVFAADVDPVGTRLDVPTNRFATRSVRAPDAPPPKRA